MRLFGTQFSNVFMNVDDIVRQEIRGVCGGCLQVVLFFLWGWFFVVLLGRKYFIPGWI